MTEVLLPGLVGSPRSAPADLFGGGRSTIHQTIDKMRPKPVEPGAALRAHDGAGWSPKTKTGALRKPRSVTSLLAITGCLVRDIVPAPSGMVLIR
jgi:hypothetical protein